MLTIFTEAPNVWKTLIDPLAPLAKLADAMSQSGFRRGYVAGTVTACNARPTKVISRVVPPVALAKVIAASLASSPPDQKTRPFVRAAASPLSAAAAPPAPAPASPSNQRPPAGDSECYARRAQRDRLQRIQSAVVWQ